jgi:hypothetical protein
MRRVSDSVPSALRHELTLISTIICGKRRPRHGRIWEGFHATHHNGGEVLAWTSRTFALARHCTIGDCLCGAYGMRHGRRRQ